MKIDQKKVINLLVEILCSLNKASSDKKRSKFSKDQKQVLTLDKLMYSIMNFLSFLVATYLDFKEYVCYFSAAHELHRIALAPDYGLFIGYQMPADKREGLNAFLFLLR